jgi:FkbM family methyltransferase
MPVLGTFGLDLPDRGRVRFSTQVEDWFLTSLYWKGLDRGGAMNLRVFRRLVTGCGTILDIGANIGLFSMAAALDSPTSVVHAFEPLPVNFQILSSMIRANRAVNIHAHELALSGHEGEAEFFVPRQAHGMSARDASLIAGFREDCERVPVRLATLDRVVTQHGLRGIDLIKVDVESAEYLVFPGASRVLRNERPVILCEVLYGTTEQQLHEELAPHQYIYFWISGEGLVEQTQFHADPTDTFRDYLRVPAEKRRAVVESLSPMAEVGGGPRGC